MSPHVLTGILAGGSGRMALRPVTQSITADLGPQLTALRGVNIGALQRSTYTILGVPYYRYSILGP